MDNKNKNKIIFDNDDNLEKFYDKYGYEPDEQTSEIQNTSIGYVKKLSKNIWYHTLFPAKNLNLFGITNNFKTLFIY